MIDKIVDEYIMKYLESQDGSRDHKNTTVQTVFEGQEPLNFTSWFRGWDHDLSNFLKYDDPHKNEKNLN